MKSRSMSDGNPPFFLCGASLTALLRYSFLESTVICVVSAPDARLMLVKRRRANLPAYDPVALQHVV